MDVNEGVFSAQSACDTRPAHTLSCSRARHCRVDMYGCLSLEVQPALQPAAESSDALPPHNQPPQLDTQQATRWKTIPRDEGMAANFDS